MINEPHIKINISEQCLGLFYGDEILKEYSVSTARNGPGELKGSECTPRGEHVIAEKIGDGCEANTIFIGRQAMGEIYKPELRQQHPYRDWIVTRILWLSGQEQGRNQGGDVDSHERYIYIHGAPYDVEMDKPGSRGCIRMRNKDVIELFGMVDVGIRVVIE
jgi:lipoprotein-anchoring transpeptidase ErfK/SrfK